MQSTSAPNKFLVPWAQNDVARVEIPVTTTDATRASQTQGFPPLTMQPPEVGGVPPQGQDFNGGLNQVARAAWWVMLGSLFVYDSAFATDTNIGGYPKGSQLLRADLAGLWLNGAENNSTNPDDNTGTSANWLPGYTYGAASIAVSTATTVYPVNAAKRTLLLTGTLTANSVVTLPAWVFDWYIVDNTTRAGFTLTVKTASGTGVVIASGAQSLHGDGTNIVQPPLSIPNATTSTQALNKGQADALYAPAGLEAASIQGAFKNLAISTTGTSAPVTVTADELIVESTANLYKTLRGVSVTPSLANPNGANGLDAGVKAASTGYFVWVIWNNTTVSGLLSLSSTAPTMPATYTYKARVSWIKTDPSGNAYPLAMNQSGRRVQYKVTPASNVAAIPVMSSGTQGNPLTPTYVPVSTASFIPSTASAIHLVVSNGAGAICVAPNANYGAANATTNFPPFGQNASVSLALPVSMVVESTNIYYAASASSSALACFGYDDNI